MKQGNILLYTLYEYIKSIQSNYSEYLSKYKASKSKSGSKERQEEIRLKNESELKTDAISNILKTNEKYSDGKFELINEHLNDIKDSIKDKCHIEYELETKGKLVLGWSPIYFITEFPIAWDLLLDIPYIPGSIIKGMLRYYYSSFIGEDEVFEMIFGGGASSKRSMGLATFLDAYPIGFAEANAKRELLSLDIITPHYPEGIKDEYEVEPNPIKFVTINRGVRFRGFIIFEDAEILKNKFEDFLVSFVISAKMGWGRRTTRGLGEMEISSQGNNFSLNNIWANCGGRNG